jgi:anti-sigma B factor antagonist
MADSVPVTLAPAGPVVVRLPAEIDTANADGLGEQFAAALAPGVRLIIADMTATTFCDFSGTRMLALAWQQAIANGTEMRLAVPGPDALRVLQVQGLGTVLPIYQTLAEALACGGTPRPGDPPPGAGNHQ